MKRFGVIWVGQLASLVGTGMTRFALVVFVYQEEGTATAVALVGFSAFVPFVLVSPLAGVWVDRHDRKRTMLVADLAAGLSSVGLLVALTVGDLQLWHVYVATAAAGMAEAFQVPAFSTVITLLVPKVHYVRASGMRSLAESMSQIAAPALAGLVLLVTDVRGVLVVDVATFLVAVGTLLAVPVPPATSPKGPGERPQVWLEVGEAVRFIRDRPGLPGLLGFFAAVNLLGALTYFAVLPVLVLARTDQDTSSLATVQTALGVGGVVGGVLVTTWGGPRRRIHGVLGGAALSFALGDVLFAVGRTVPVWVLAGFLASLFIPFITGADQAIWQAKTPLHLQGRVFALRGMIRLATMPVGYALAGPLVDQVFEPAMRPDGALAGVFGDLVGTGAGAGVAVMFLFTGVLGAATSLAGYLVPSVREVDERLPDHDHDHVPS